MSRFLCSRFMAVAMIAAAGLVSMTSSGAGACSLAVPEPHTLDAAEQAVDTTPPDPPSLLELRVVRGQGPQSAGCGGSSSTSCDDIGQIGLNLLTVDDRTETARIGYRITLAGGSLPSGLLLPDEPVRSNSGDGEWIWLHWADGATDDQERIDFSLTITAVDLAGNESAPATTIDIVDAGGFLNWAAHRNPFLPVAILMALLAINILRQARRLRLYRGCTPLTARRTP